MWRPRCRVRETHQLSSARGAFHAPYSPLFNPPPTQNTIPQVAHGGLTRSDPVARLVKADVEFPFRQQFYRRVGRRATIADLHLGTKGKRGKSRGERGLMIDD